MSIIYLKVTIETFSNFDFQGLKNLSPGQSLKSSLFEELQLTQISLNFKSSCCNLKIRGLGAKLSVAFPLFLFWKELWGFKVKESMQFFEQKYKL